MDPVVAQRTLSVVALAIYAFVAAAHLIGLRRTASRSSSDAAAPRSSADIAVSQPGWIRQAVLFQSGLLVALIALISPLGYWSQTYLWVRAIQDILLAFVAPALIVAGRPWIALREVLPGAPARADRSLTGTAGIARSAVSEDPPQLETGWSETRPLLAVVVFNLVWLGWHLPVAFDLVARNSAVRLAEYACYLGAGVWFWLQVAGPRRYGRWQPPLRRLALVTVTVAAGTVLGMVLVFGSHVVYPAYENAAHHVMTTLDDQQLSGAVLWMGTLPPLIVAAVALLMTWLNEEETNTPADPGLLFKHRTSGWAARSRLR
jgi:putative membrane protein